MTLKKIIIIATLVLGISCNKTTENSTTPFDVVQWRTNFIENIETPSIANFVTSINDLNNKVSSFTEEVNLENLIALQDSWKAATLGYSKTEILNIGTVRTSAIYNSFYSWTINDGFITEYIDGVEEITEEKINSSSTNIRGLGAVEFLIFNDDNEALLELFTNVRRKQFLAVLGKNLVNKVTILETSWSSYKTSFLSNNQTGINGAVNMVVNQMNAILEDVRKFKLGEPAGLENSSTPNIDLLQAAKSEFSLELIKENINSIRNIYFNGEEGLSAYVASITGNDDLNKTIENQFVAIDNDIANFNNESIKDALTSNNIVIIEALYKDVNSLLLHIKSDLASTLSIIVTFTDNDGD